MSLPWKILLVFLFLVACWLLYRDANSPLCHGSECLTNNVVYVTNFVYGLGATNLGNAANNIAPNNGFQATNKLESMQYSNTFYRGEFSFGCAGSDRWVYFDGDLFKVGCPSEFGRVVVLERDFIICVDENKHITYLLPRKNDKIRKNPPPDPARVSLQAAHGHGGGVSW